jgi:hypothetical protein
MVRLGKVGDEFKRRGKNGFDARVRSLGEADMGFQVIIAKVTDYYNKEGVRGFNRVTRRKEARINGFNVPRNQCWQPVRLFKLARCSPHEADPDPRAERAN